jgi:hypothetical protein
VGRLALADDAVQSRPWFVVVGQRIYVCRRVVTDDLRLIGYAALEGAAAVKAVEEQVAAERRQMQDLFGLKGEAREQKAAEVLAKLQDFQRQRLAAMTSTPDQKREYAKRCTAYICASVFRYGAVRPDAEIPDFVHVLPEGADPGTIAVDLRDAAEVEAEVNPIYAEPLQFVEAEGDHNPEAGRMWVHRIPQAHREALGTAIMSLHHQATVGEVLPFREDTGAGDLVSLAGEGVRAAAARDPAADPVREGVQPVVPAGRKQGRGRGRQGEARVR